MFMRGETKADTRGEREMKEKGRRLGRLHVERAADGVPPATLSFGSACIRRSFLRLLNAGP